MSIIEKIKKDETETARLIPVGASGNLENRATSVFLATLQVVEGFAKEIFKSIGETKGKRTNIKCFTEVVFLDEDDKTERPDGLIVITKGKKEWSALVEAKIGNAELDEDQIERYTKLAKKYHIDAVISISNQFTVLPTHHPVKLKKTLTKSVNLFHWSWTFILTQAIYSLDVTQDIDPEQKYILKEMIRYFEHDSTGVKQFTSMNKEWRELCLQVKADAPLIKTSDAVINTIGAWQQETKDISLFLTQYLKAPVSIHLKPSHISDPEARLKDMADNLANNHILESAFKIPDTASLLYVCADLDKRKVKSHMILPADKDKVSTKARVNALLRQIKNAKDTEIHVKATWPSRTKDTSKTLAELREKPECIQCENPKLAPASFHISQQKDLAGRFSGSRTFLEGLNNVVEEFYKNIGEHLKSPRPSAPKFKKTLESEVKEQDFETV